MQTEEISGNDGDLEAKDSDIAPAKDEFDDKVQDILKRSRKHLNGAAKKADNTADAAA
jgi:hypothetical protein